MATKNLFIGIICSTLFFVSCNTANKQTDEAATESPSTQEMAYAITTNSTSVVKWKGVMLGVKEHFGTISLKEGTLSVNNGQVSGGSFTFDMTTIKPTDANYDTKTGATPERLVGHLTSPDFFDVANNPTSSFAIDSVNGNEAIGTLTIRGKSNSEVLKNIVVKEENGTVKASGTLTYDRKKYGVAFDMPMKDMVISKDIEMAIEISGSKK